MWMLSVYIDGILSHGTHSNHSPKQRSGRHPCKTEHRSKLPHTAPQPPGNLNKKHEVSFSKHLT